MDETEGSGDHTRLRELWALVDQMHEPTDEARSMVMFQQVMQKLEGQRQRERWWRRLAAALVGLAGAHAVRMIAR